MKITPHHFEAYLKCPTKCWLRSVGERSAGNAYAEWVETQTESYRADGIKRLLAERAAAGGFASGECALSTLKSARWRVAVDFVAQTSIGRGAGSFESLPTDEPRGLSGPRSGLELESRRHAVERIPSEGRGKAAQFIPIRFIYRNKLTTDDKLLHRL